MSSLPSDDFREPVKHPASIGILHAGALGDCVLTLHVAKALGREGHPVTVIARSPIAAWAARRKLIDQFIWLDRVQWLWRAGAAAGDYAGGGDSEPLRDFGRVISFLGGAGEEVAGRLDQACGPGRVMHIEPKPTEKTIREGTHITQQWMGEIARHLGSSDSRTEIKNPNPNPPIVESRRERKEVDEGGGVLNVIVHPGSGGRAKCCPLEAMEAIVAELERRGAAVRWMIGPDEMERDGAALRERLARTARVVFEESVERAADLVAQADAFIGNDSGMAHVAGIAGVTTVVLFGPTDPRVWGPLGANCRVLGFPDADGPVDAWVAKAVECVGG